MVRLRYINETSVNVLCLHSVNSPCWTVGAFLLLYLVSTSYPLPSTSLHHSAYPCVLMTPARFPHMTSPAAYPHGLMKPACPCHFAVVVQLFPYSLRLLQATTPRQRVLLLPLLSLLSIVRPLLEMGYSFGILTPFVRVAAIISLADFWQVRHQNKTHAHAY